VTAEAQTGVPADLMDTPSLALDDAQLGDLELLLSGVFAPLAGFMNAADVTAVVEQGTLADGTPWPIPVTLDVGEDAVPADVGQVVLTDPEGTPLAVLDIAERSEPPAAGAGPASGLIRLAGPVTGLREPEHGPFRRLMLRPADARVHQHRAARVGDHEAVHRPFAAIRTAQRRQVQPLDLQRHRRPPSVPWPAGRHAPSSQPGRPGVHAGPGAGGRPGPVRPRSRAATVSRPPGINGKVAR